MNSESPYLIGFIIVSWILGLCGVFDVLFQPKTAFRAAGHSKRLWLAVEVLGTLLSYTGVLTWLAYSIWIRPGVVRAGGHRRTVFGGIIRAFAAAAKSSAGSSQGPNRTAPVTSGAFGSKPAESCGSCGGRGQQSCFACQGRGRITIAAYAAHAGTSDGWCTPCGGSGKTRCGSCNGSGKR